MPGPPPKDPKLRQRRNRVSTRATLVRTAKPRQRAPSLPRERKWHTLTKKWWHDIWHSPMADEYLRADRHALYRLATLIDLFWSEPTKELAAEIRLEQQAFGLTPLDRRRLQWSIEQVETAKSKTRTKQPEEEQADPRELLKVVNE